MTAVALPAGQRVLPALDGAYQRTLVEDGRAVYRGDPVDHPGILL